MHFNSLTYATFLVLVCLLYWATSSQRVRHSVLLASSFFFYATWSAPFVLLLLLSIFVDYYASHAMVRRPDRKRIFLLISIATNLGVLGFFKYADFIGENLFGLGGRMGLVSGDFQPFHFVLPLGISFYTFQTMSYTIDVYRSQTRPVDSLFRFALYVTFFPQLVAGPIVRATEMLPQLATRKSPDLARTVEGLTRIGTGLIKKVLIADWLAVVVESVFQAPAGFDGLTTLAGVYAYAFQIFFDFSGYCDIAIGSALLIGFRLPENFLAPYLSDHITEFWRRWHVTLSTWLRDYLYIPLGGNRKGAIRTRVNLMLTMLLGGLWHGAAWTFVVWGGLHGLFLIAHRVWSRRGARMPMWLARWTTFHVVCFAWIFFRATSFGNAREVVESIARLNTTNTPLEWLWAALLAPAALLIYAVLHHAAERARAWRPAQPVHSLAYGVGLGLLVIVLCFATAAPAQFVYFQF